MLHSGEKWPLINGFINYNTILQLDICKREGKWDEIPSVQSFMILYQNKLAQKRCKILLQQHSDTKKSVLPESNWRKEDNLLIIELNPQRGCQSSCPSTAAPFQQLEHQRDPEPGPLTFGGGGRVWKDFPFSYAAGCLIHPGNH